ncbi:MAG TPA: Flp pilus assembly protein CpaB, partial [Polyangiales bacterium]|nr:Flp pilus assembly protein CpaB [Polyangiales bacterium]
MPKKALTAAFVSMLVGMALLELYVRTFEARATGGAKVGLLVATSDLRSGEVLARDKLGVRAIPQAYVEGRHVRASDVDRVVGARLLVPEKVGETLLWTDIAGMSSRQRALSALVPEGMRAFSVHAANAAFGGLLEPGDRVDVVLGGRELEVDGAKTPPVVENVVVLAIGDRTEVRSELDSEREA